MQVLEFETLSGETVTIQNIKAGPCRHDSIEKLPVFENVFVYKYQCCECDLKFTEEEFRSITNH